MKKTLFDWLNKGRPRGSKERFIIIILFACMIAALVASVLGKQCIDDCVNADRYPMRAQCEFSCALRALTGDRQ